MVPLAALVVVVAACGPRAGDLLVATPREGISLAVYAPSDGAGFGIVDDRRWIAITDGELVIERFERDASLASLVIEPLDGAPLRIGPCVRGVTVEREPNATPPSTLAPSARCRAEGKPGRRFVRIAYVSPGFTFEPRHAIEVRGARARIATSYTIATPRWQRASEVTLMRGVPGGPRGARELVRGSVTLDGGAAVLHAKPREVPAAIRVVFDGALRGSDDDPRAESWGGNSRSLVMVWLELSGALERGPVQVQLDDAREVAVPANGRDKVGGAVRLPLWIDEQLIGHRERKSLFFDVHHATETVTISLANRGAFAREVWIEERLRPARERAIRGRSGTPPKIVGAGRAAVARAVLVVAPGSTANLEFIVDYAF